MTTASIADLAVLGIASEGPIEPDRIASIAKALVPEHWQPTGSVIAAVIERQLAEGGLRRTGNHIADEHVTATAAGVDRIRALILSRPEDLAPSALPAAEAIQFCFLDTMDPETARDVLARFQERVKRRLTSHQKRNALCPYGGRYTSFWRDMEQHRLQSMVHFLTGVSDETGAGGHDGVNVTEISR